MAINFFGCIKTKYTSHEVKGLNVVVRLVKEIKTNWPRLTKQNETERWLSYKTDAISVTGASEIGM